MAQPEEVAAVGAVQPCVAVGSESPTGEEGRDIVRVVRVAAGTHESVRETPLSVGSSDDSFLSSRLVDMRLVCAAC